MLVLFLFYVWMQLILYSFLDFFHSSAYLPPLNHRKSGMTDSLQNSVRSSLAIGIILLFIIAVLALSYYCVIEPL